MKTVMSMKWEGITPDQYEKLRKSVNWEGNKPKGAIFHLAGFTGNTIHVTDIWESADDFNTFVRNRLMPATTAMGIKSEPKVELYPVHASIVMDAHKLAGEKAVY